MKATLSEMPQPIADMTALNATVKANDAAHRSKGKSDQDAKKHAKPSNLAIRDIVLVKQRRTNKLSTPFDPRPLTVSSRNGSRLTASHGSYKIARNAKHLKPFDTTLPMVDTIISSS